MTQQNDQQRLEALGPAGTILSTLLTHADHMVHNRPGLLVEDARTVTGLRWAPVTHRVDAETGDKVVFRQDKVAGKKKGQMKTEEVRVGVMNGTTEIREGGRVVGRYQPAGLYPEVAAYLYGKVAEVWKVDNEFVARWASYAFDQEHKDMKVVLAAFMLVQNRYGEPYVEDGKAVFYDDDFRSIGEAMLLLNKRGKDFNAKQIDRIWHLLRLPQIAEINRELGFGRSAKNPTLGRWPAAVRLWLQHREHNPKMLAGLAKGGMGRIVRHLAERSHFKPTTQAFYETLRWKQLQADSGHRSLGMDMTLEEKASWVGLSEAEICQKIVTERPGYKVMVSMLPMGLTAAIMAAAVQAGSLSDKDLIILTPTLEDLGLLQDADVKQRWDKAVKNATDQRALNVARKVKRADTVEALEEAADTAMAAAVEEAVKGLRVYFIVDKSSSMRTAITKAKDYATKLLAGFPLDKFHLSIFNSQGTELTVKHASRAGIEQAFRGHDASGYTDYGAGLLALRRHQPLEDEDALVIFVGDQGQRGDFAPAVRASGLNPVAFAMVDVERRPADRVVEETARVLGIPCFALDEEVVAGDDPYAKVRALRNLIMAAPVATGPVYTSAPKRKSLIETILETDLLTKPVWAEA